MLEKGDRVRDTRGRRMWNSKLIETGAIKVGRYGEASPNTVNWKVLTGEWNVLV